MLRSGIPLLIAVSCLCAGAALAQTPAPAAPAASSPAAAPPTTTAMPTAEDVSKWTRKQWNAAKAKWASEKDKWDGCEKQAKTQKLAGRKSWQFLYDCMSKG
jgi:hypothetical protein